MNKIKELNFSGSIIVFFLLLFVYAKWGPAIPFSTTTQQKGNPFVATGQGKVAVSPNTAKITLGIEESGDTLKEVQDNVNQKSQSLVKELKKYDISDKDIKTVYYNVYPNYDYESSTTQIVGYRVSTGYEVTVPDIDQLNDVISTVTSTGVNNIGNISFELDEKTKKEKLQEARELAITEAKEKADGLAKAAGVNLGKIVNISENQSGVTPKPMLDTARSLAIGSEESAPVQPDIQPGETEISVSVSLSYEVR